MSIVKVEVDDLKNAIKEKQSPLLDDIRASKLVLFQVTLPDEGIQANLEKVDSPTSLIKATARISKIFGTSPLPEETIHVIVQRPSPGKYDYNYTTSLSSCQPSRTSTPTFDQDVSLALKKIAAEFFQPDSDHSMFLKEFVSGMYQLPVTESGIKGLPRVGKRGPSKSRTAPTLLFFDLPTEGQPNKNLSIVEQILADNPGLRHLPYTDYQ
ncbi:hypothetical protein BX616_004753, partial [Lobosporangium transversale]